MSQEFNATSSSRGVHSSPRPLAGRVALITGGGSGMGASTARLLSSRGADIVLVGRRQDALETVAKSIASDGGRVEVVPTDVTDPAACRRMIDVAVERFGKLDYAANCAGAGARGAFLDLTVGDLTSMIEVNLAGVFSSMQAEIPAMLEAGGSIVNVASVGGLIGIPHVSHYVASKHAMVGLTKSVALEFATRGVRVNAVAPGTTDTEMIAAAHPDQRAAFAAEPAMARMARADEIALCIHHLLVEATFSTGSVLVTDGGQLAG